MSFNHSEEGIYILLHLDFIYFMVLLSYFDGIFKSIENKFSGFVDAIQIRSVSTQIINTYRSEKYERYRNVSWKEWRINYGKIFIRVAPH